MADLRAQVALVTVDSRGAAVGLAHAGATVFATGRTINRPTSKQYGAILRRRRSPGSTGLPTSMAVGLDR